MQLREQFDNWGASADKKYARRQWLLSKWEVHEGIEWPAPKIELLVDHLRRGLDLKKSARLIDLGCGGGWILERLRPFTKEAFGLDFSLPMLGHARAHKGLIGGEIGRLPIKDGRFERAVSNYVFMNFADDAYVERSLLEIHRILKKGGRALIGQLPDSLAQTDYEKAKEAYSRYCAQQFKVGRSIREDFKPPLRLFDRAQLSEFLNKMRINHDFQDAFNPFFHRGEPKTVPWRFDLILTK